MMQFVSNNSELSFEVTYDSPSLNVGMTILDDSGATPVVVSGPTKMTNVIGNMYRAKFTPVVGKAYLVYKTVYTDALLTVVNSDYNSASEAFVCQKSLMLDGQIVVRKNKPLANFTFVMLDQVNQAPTAGLVVTGVKSKDGGAFAPCDNSIIEIGNGFYKINLTANDLNADVVAFSFKAVNSDETILTMLTQA